MKVFRCCVWLVPPCYFVVIAGLQPADRWVRPIGTTEGYPLPSGFARAVTDDADVAAYVLRAENASRGRLAGTSIEPDRYDEPEFRKVIRANPALTPRYFLEYPPAALGFFRLGYSGLEPVQGDISGAILDANQFSTTMYTPRTEAEQQLWRNWRKAQQRYAFLMLAALSALMLVVSRGVGKEGTAAGPVWLFVLPGMLYFTPCRFDLLPAALVVFAYALTDRRRPLLGALVFGTAVALKTYPLVLAPLLLRYCARDWRTAISWCCAVAVPIVISVIPLLLSDGLPALIEPLKFQTTRGIEPYALFGWLFPLPLASPEPGPRIIRILIVLGVALALCVRKPPNMESLLRRSAIAVIVFLSMQVFYSPQWWQWIAVLLIPLVRTHRGLLLLVVLSDLLTHAFFPWFFDMNLNGLLDVEGQNPELLTTVVTLLLVYIRAILWAVTVVVLLYAEARRRSV